MTYLFTDAGRQRAVPFNATVQPGVPPDTRRLEISIEDAGPDIRLGLRGTLDTSISSSVYDAIVASAAAPSGQVHLDLSGLYAATRAGCRAIYVAAKLLYGRGGRMTIYGASPNIELVLKNAGFDALLEFREPSPSHLRKVA
jgi:anti-anti-sigma factor